ncbi:hypothetical protein [Aeromonas sp. 30P]|uniref:hypothetical protein n=1 Tax=Aeromonas sp. 30P TaxID=3452717 RepID=UPI003F3AF8F3
MRQLQLMERIYDATIMGIASSYQSLWNLLNEQFKKNSPYQIKCEKYHFDRVKIIQHYRKPAPANMAGAGLKVTAI